MLDANYRPLGEMGNEESEPRPPIFPERVAAFELACSEFAWEDDMRMHGFQIKRSRVHRLSRGDR